MKINAIYNSPLPQPEAEPTFKGGKLPLVRLYTKSNCTLDEFLKKNEPIIEQYAKKHGIKEVRLGLKEAVRDSVRYFKGEYGDLLMIGAGPKTKAMRYDHTTPECETLGTILKNIQENYNLTHLGR